MIDLSGAAWRTSSYSAASQNCVEVARGETCTSVRDTKDRDGATLLSPTRSWTTIRHSRR